MLVDTPCIERSSIYIYILNIYIYNYIHILICMIDPLSLQSCRVDIVNVKNHYTP